MEWEKKFEEENSCLKAELESAWADLESSRADLESANNDLDLAHSELRVVRSELESVRYDKEMDEWIIEIQESQIRKKRHEASRFWKERDSCVWELKEQKRRESSKAEVALIRATLDQAKEQALKEFRGSKDFKVELIAVSRLAYVVGYEDDQDAIG